MFKDYLEDLYPTKSQEGIQIIFYYLLVTRRWQDPIATLAYVQNFHIS